MQDGVVDGVDVDVACGWISTARGLLRVSGVLKICTDRELRVRWIGETPVPRGHSFTYKRGTNEARAHLLQLLSPAASAT